MKNLMLVLFFFSATSFSNVLSNAEFGINRYLPAQFVESLHKIITSAPSLYSDSTTFQDLKPAESLATFGNSCILKLYRNRNLATQFNQNGIFCNFTYSQNEIAAWVLNLDKDVVIPNDTAGREGSMIFYGPGANTLYSVLKSYKQLSESTLTSANKFSLDNLTPNEGVLSCEKNNENKISCSYTLPSTPSQKVSISLGENSTILFYIFFSKLHPEFNIDSFDKVSCSYEGLAPEFSYEGIYDKDARLSCKYVLKNGTEGEDAILLDDGWVSAWGNRYSSLAVEISGMAALKINAALEEFLQSSPNYSKDPNASLYKDGWDGGRFYQHNEIALRRFSYPNENLTVSLHCYSVQYDDKHSQKYPNIIPVPGKDISCVFSAPK
jgi:hypothetical protein